MRLWSFWFPDILPRVMGCPEPVVTAELLRAAQEFFNKTRAWKVTQALVSVAANQTTVTLTPSASDQDVVRLEQAWYENKPLDVLAPQSMDARFADDWRNHTGTPTALVQEIVGTALLYPIPTAASTVGLKLRYSVRPNETSTGLPDDIGDQYGEAIADGAMARLLLIPNAVFFNAGLADVKRAAFLSAISSYQAAAWRGHNGSQPRARVNWC